MDILYMDNAATSFPKPECVYDAVDHFNRNLGANPGRGTNVRTMQAGAVVLEAREALAQLFNIRDSAQIAFMANVTEAINTGLKGWLQPGDHIITTSMEHNSVARPIYAMTQRGVEWTILPCSTQGDLDPKLVEKTIKSNTRMICMLHASNLVGTIMPIAEVGRIARRHEIVFMVDTAQTAGVLELDVEKQNIDLLAFTGHKGLFGPQGTGGLYVRPGLEITPLKEGGTGSSSESLQQPDFMPDRLESGTLNTPGIVGLKAGVEFILSTGREQIQAHEQRLTNILLEELPKIKRVQVYGHDSKVARTAVVAFNIEGMDCGELSMRLEYDYGIVTRSGLHCTPLAHETLGTTELGACRLSPGFFNSENDMERVLLAIRKISA